MLDDINTLKQEVTDYSISNEEELEAFRLEFLSRSGKVQSMFSRMSEVPKEKKAEVGRAMNEVKNIAQQTFEEAEKRLQQEESTDLTATDDITLPAPPYPAGSFHPLTQTMEEMKNIFYRLGFSIADGPEIEDDFHNFTALNFPPNHPARDEQDTFFIENNNDQDLVLRTHTSPVQIRLMQEKEPPIRSIMPGRVYRNEAVSPKSYFLFHQVEALYVDTNVSIAELKETLISFVKLMFGADVKYRLRPGYFPFTEPSLEMDVWWVTNDPNDEGRWLEILGSGMVDPNVLKAVNIDPEKYTGYAWGMGVERIAMLRHQIDDIRIFYNNDVRFLEQFH